MSNPFIKIIIAILTFPFWFPISVFILILILPFFLFLITWLFTAGLFMSLVNYLTGKNIF